MRKKLQEGGFEMRNVQNIVALTSYDRFQKNAFFMDLYYNYSQIRLVIALAQN